MGRAIGDVLDAILSADIESAVSDAAHRVSASPAGKSPTTITPKIPVVAVTGTNGKTTTSRMIAHIARTDGKLVGWSNTDGIYIDGEMIEAGDYSGPSGAGRILAHKNVEFAVTETARGGILLKGIGLTRNDVSVVTNVTADHLGPARHRHRGPARRGEVRRRPDHPQGAAGRCSTATTPASMPCAASSRRSPGSSRVTPDSPAIREVLGAGGRATTVIDGWLSVLDPTVTPTRSSSSSTSR